MSLEVLSEQHCFDGVQGFYRMQSLQCDAPMRFGLYLPPQARAGRVPTILCLAGLTCSEETFAIKAGAQRIAAQLGLALITPDTSPRNTGIAGEADDWECGAGAGFYVDATQAPWSSHYRMYSHVSRELPDLIGASFPVDTTHMGILGHSMGGHGALSIALRNPLRFLSVSAFAPIVAPSEVPWGLKALPRFLGEDRSHWLDYDACKLVARNQSPNAILIDQGEADRFLAEQLRPELFEAACASAGQALRLRRHPGYDHSYWFIASFIEDHLRHHARILGLPC